MSRPRVLVVVTVFLALVAGIGLLVRHGIEARQKARVVRCSNNMKQIAMAALQFSDDKRSLPRHDFLGALRRFSYDDDPESFVCPESGLPYGCYTDTVPDPSMASVTSASVPLVWDREPHADGSRHVIRWDVRLVTFRDPEKK